MSSKGGKHEGGVVSRGLLTILILAIVIRLIYSFAVFPVVGPKLNWQGVDDGYDEIARNLLSDGRFVNRVDQPVPNLLTPPGYCFFLYGIYKLTGPEVNEGIRVRIVQPLIDAGSCFLIFMLGMRVLGSRRIAMLGALAWAIYPQIIVYSARVAPEVLFVFLLLAMMIAWIRVMDDGRVRDALLLGLLWGLAVLTKEKVILLPLVILPMVAFRAPALPFARLKLAAIAALFMALTIAPWIARGYAVTGEIYPITLRSGRALHDHMDSSFAGADNEAATVYEWLDTTGSGTGVPAPPGRAADSLAAAGAARENSLIGKAFARIATDPLPWLRSFVTKLAAFWYYGQPKVIWGNILIQVPLVLLAIAGYVTGWNRHRFGPFLAISVYFMVIHAATLVRMRYSLPVMPYTILAALSFLDNRFIRR